MAPTISWLQSDLLSSAIEGVRRLKVTLGNGQLAIDAWGRPKATMDYSLFHGMFTFDIPPEMWIKYKNGTEVLDFNDTADFFSENGKGVIKGNGTTSYLMTKRHPRYQPNRGHLYSSSIILPSKDATGTRRFGLFNSESGMFFELEDGILYAVIRTTIDGVLSDTRAIINNDMIDLENGNIFDIQAQWRGVGNIKFFIGNPSTGESDLVYTYEHLNTRPQLSIFNPALPIGFESIGDVQIECGCCDLTSEGGKRETRFYSTVDTGEVSLSTQERSVLAFRINMQYNGNMNTRDCVLTRISGYANDNTIIRMYYTRDTTAITATWSDVGKGFQSESVDGAVTSFDTTKMQKLSTRRIPINGNVEIENPDKVAGDFTLIHGDIILVTMEAKNNTIGGVFLEYSQEI